MPRSRASTRSSRPRSAPPPAVRPPSSPAPPPAVHQAQPSGMMRGMGGAIADGMAFGGGSAVAHRAVDAVMGPRTIHHEVTQTTQATGGLIQETDACVNQAKAFKDCLNANANDVGKCQFYVDMLTECRKSAGAEAPQSSG